MSKIDHHLHTTRYSPDSSIDPYDLLEKAVELKLNGVVITEHDEQWPADELAELQSHRPELLVLSGVEVSAREGHFLVYGLPDLNEVQPGILLRDLLAVVHAYNAAIVGAHPFRWGQDFTQIVTDHGPVFDGLELVSNNVTPETRSDTAHLLQSYPTIGATGSSDAHQRSTIGCYYTHFEADIRSMADFVRALKSRRFRPGYQPDGPLSSGPVE